jgi:hypothetical protein
MTEKCQHLIHLIQTPSGIIWLNYPRKIPAISCPLKTGRQECPPHTNYTSIFEPLASSLFSFKKLFIATLQAVQK